MSQIRLSTAGLKDLLKTTFVRVNRSRRAGRSLAWRFVPRRLRLPHELVDRFDMHEYERDLIAALTTALTRAGVQHLVLDQRTLPTKKVAIIQSDAAKARRAILLDPATRDCWAAPANSGFVGPAAPLRWSPAAFPGASGLLLSRNLVTAAGALVIDSETGILLEFWKRSDSREAGVGGGSHDSGTVRAPDSNGVLDFAGPHLWASIQRNDHRLPARPPHLMLLQEPVDLVYTWVDGSDPAWQARKAESLGTTEMREASVDAAIEARFDNRDELKYSLRSVEMFASWVRRIWIVTDQQVPSWLRQDDRLRVVDHREIFADPSALPVYNSHAIESQLHHIPGLAEHYVYANDDMLFGARVEPEDFFHGNGISKFFTSPALLDAGDHDPRDLAVAAAAKNNRDFIEAEFGKTITHKLRHTPQAQVRSVIEAFEAAYPSLFDSVMRSRLRHPSNYSLPSSLSQYYAFATGRAVSGRILNGYMDLAAKSPEVTLELWLRRRRLQTMCINDSGEDSAALRAEKDAALRDFFETYFPLPSRWEA